VCVQGVVYAGDSMRGAAASEGQYILRGGARDNMRVAE